MQRQATPKGLVLNRPSPRRPQAADRRPGPLAPAPVPATPRPIPARPRPIPARASAGSSLASPPPPAPLPEQGAGSGVSYLAVIPRPSGSLSPWVGGFESQLEAVEIKAVQGKGAVDTRSLKLQRGYRSEDLEAIAEIAVQYLHSGALLAARTILEGLVAIDPEDPYFVLALGLSYEREGRLEQALEAYRCAARLDPREARAEINAAEVLISRDDLAQARPLLVRAIRASKVNGEPALEQKARALLVHLDGLAARKVSS